MKERKSKEFMEVEDRILLKCFHVKEPLINYCLRSPSRMVQYVPVLGSNSADIWSVGCTIIEMATGKPPWNQQQFEEVSALFHDGTTMPHPPIPDFLSSEAKSFLLKCLQKEPHLRPTASELLQDPFLTKKPLRQHQSHMDHNLSGRGDMPESSYDSAIDPNKLQRPLPEFVDPLSAFCASFGGNSVPGWGVMPESSYNFAINPNRFHKPLPEFVDPLSAFCATFGRNLVPGRGALPESSDNSGH